MKRGLLAILAIATGFVATTASAQSQQDRSLQPGHACKFYGKQGGDDYFSPSGLKANGLRNTSTTSRYVVCGINKDPERDTSVAWISFSDYTEDCVLYKRHKDGTSWGSFPPTEINGVGPVTQGWGLGYDTSDNVLSIYCSVRPDVVINSFYHATTWYY
jgi:hypothetical protein